MRRLLRILLAEPSPWLVIAAAAVVLVLYGCAGVPFDREPQSGFFCANVTWVRDGFLCPTVRGDVPSGGCASAASPATPGQMWLIKPQSWEDVSALWRAGHELMHVLGASHE
jgi:hypothetical protein